VAEKRFFFIFDLHTAGGRFSYPWSYKEEPAPDQELFQAVGEAFARHQPYHQYAVHQSFSWYQILGSSKDWFYGRYGSPAVTIEVGDPKAFDMTAIGIRILNPFFQYNPADPDPWIQNDREALLWAVDKAYELTGGNPLPPLPLEWEDR
jgi:hypothetical protein